MNKEFKPKDIVKISELPEDFAGVLSKDTLGLIGKVSSIHNGGLIVVRFTELIEIFDVESPNAYQVFPAHKDVITHATDREKFLYELFGSKCLKEEDNEKGKNS